MVLDGGLDGIVSLYFGILDDDGGDRTGLEAPPVSGCHVEGYQRNVREAVR